MAIEDYHSCRYPLEWHGCYDKDAKYNKYVTPDSFAHPAKMSWGLLEHIFKHLQEMRILKPDHVIIDFMAGSGRTLIMAELFGYKSIGVELEPHFIKLIEGNMALLAKKLGRKVSMQFVQGDARQLSVILTGEKYIGLVSPPYGECLNEKKNTTSNLSREERLRTAGHIPDEFMGGVARNCSLVDGLRYSHNPANIGNLPDKLIGIVSPPYQDTAMPMGCPSHIRQLAKDGQWGEAIELEKQAEAIQVSKGNKFSVSSDGAIRRKIEQALEREKGNYSKSDNNIGNLKDCKLVEVTSPPYEDMMGTKHTDCDSSAKLYEDKGWNTKYSTDQDNIGAKAETYLSAMLQVYHEAYRCGISPLVIVVKNPTRGGKLRRLDLDTIAILQQAGYEIFDYHRAILFEEVTQSTLEGSTFTKPKGRLSFFKRLSYEKGNVVAQWEDIIFARIPNGASGLTGITSPPYSEAQSGGGIAIDGYRGSHIKEMGKNQPDKVGDRCGYMKSRHGINPANIGNFPDKE